MIRVRDSPHREPLLTSSAGEVTAAQTTLAPETRRTRSAEALCRKTPGQCSPNAGGEYYDETAGCAARLPPGFTSEPEGSYSRRRRLARRGKLCHVVRGMTSFGFWLHVTATDRDYWQF